MGVVSRVGFVAVTAAFAAAACGDSSGPGGGSVVLFVSPTYSQYDTADIGSEASEIEFTLKELGVTVTQQLAIDSASLATALRTTGVFIIPEQELRGLTLDLTNGAKTALRRFVDTTGGTLILNSDGGGNAFALLDTLFNYAILDGAGTATGYYPLNATAAAGTSFAGGPSVLYDADATYSLDSASLPTGAKIIYRDPGSGSVALAAIPQGRGVVVVLAYDWYNAEPHGAQGGGWATALRNAVRY
jgi:hypothetical protein